MLWIMVMATGPEKKERIVKGDWFTLAKDPPTVKSIFSLKHKERKIVKW